MQTWPGSGEPSVFERRHCVDRSCAVADADGQGCPAQGRWGLCPAHTVAWPPRRVKGVPLEVFLANAVPLSDLGACVVAFCWLGMTHPASGLCEPHLQLSRAASRPTGRAADVWAATLDWLT